MKSLKQRIAANGHALNIYATIPSAFLAEIIAHAGFDAVTIDMQHGLIGYGSALPMLTALATQDVVPMVRTPPLDPSLIMKLLDAGVLGITCAMIESGEQAAALVQCCRYPPQGDRSFGPVRVGMLHESYTDRASDLVTIFGMIETSKGVANLDEILATPGLDGIYIGQYDLAMSMGMAPSLRGELAPAVHEAIEIILSKCRAAGLICGMLALDGHSAAELVRRGFQFVTISNDIRAVQATMKGWLSEFSAVADR